MQASAGSVVANPVSVPMNCWVPPGAGVPTGVSGTVAPLQTPVEEKPVPGGPLGAVAFGPVWRSFAAGAFPSNAASMAGSLPSMPRAQMPTPAAWYEFASCALSAREVGSSK
jgi:hypothetical protein